jgi:metallo-beta-lactamase family protein
MAITLAFHGAAGTVTGSRHLFATPHARVLFDCGLFQGLKALREQNWQPPAFDARSLDSVVITHAHIDHTGYLPRLVKLGFDGPIFCTPATAELLEIMLLDSARLQEEDADYANRKGFSKHRPALPLYDTDEANRALRLVRAVDFDRFADAANGIRFRYRSAGHILGSAHVEAEAADESERASLCFSGDVGRYGAPLHADPDPPPATGALVVESTYGDRVHDHRPLVEQLAGPLRQTLGRRGTVLIPAFAVGRAQLVTLILRELMETGAIPSVPIHIDSPMAADVTGLYARYLGTDELDPGIGDPVRDRLYPAVVSIHRSVEESKRLNTLPGCPCAATEMAPAHRVDPA